MGVCFSPQPGIQGLDPRIKVDLLLIWGLAFSPACSYLNKNWGEGLGGTRECPGAKEAGRGQKGLGRHQGAGGGESQALAWVQKPVLRPACGLTNPATTGVGHRPPHRVRT